MKRWTPVIFIKAVESVIYDIRLQYKLMIAFSIIMLIPLLILGSTAASLMKNNLEEVEKKALLQSMGQLNYSIDSFLNMYLNASGMLARNVDLQQTLNFDTNSLLDAIEGRQRLNVIVRQIETGLAFSGGSGSTSAQSNAIIRFYTTNEPFASYLGDVLPLEYVESEPWFPVVYSPLTNPVWQGKVELNRQQYIALNRKITDFNNYLPLGVMRVYIPVSALKTFVQHNIPPNIYRYYYVDSQLQDVLKTDIEPPDDFFLLTVNSIEPSSPLSSFRVDRQDYLVGSITSSVTGWRLIFVAPTDVFTTSARTVSTITIISAAIALALCILISIQISDFLTKRLGVLLNKTNQVEKENFAIQQILRGKDEIGQLDQNFNNMIARIDRLIQDEFRSKLVINKVKLELLQEQINPHLLYNTLSMISLTSKENGHQDVLNVTNSLSAFYKGILSRGKIVTSIREEMAMVMNYIDIIRTVYQLQIECNVDIDEEIYDNWTIKLLLQPVVENAILHGLRQKGGGQIFISGVVSGDALEFIVSDDGIGMPDDVKDFLNSVLNLEQVEKGYGLSNVIKRVDLFWGRSYGVQIESTPNIGTTITIRIPRLTEQEISQRIDSKYIQ